MTRIALLVIMILVIPGCSSTNDTSGETPHKTSWEEADSYSAKGEYYQAWNIIIRTPPGMESKTNEYLKNNKRVYDAGKDYFSESNLENKKASGYGNKYVYYQLGDFERFASPQDFKTAKLNVNNIYGQKERDIQPQLTQDSRYGRVTGVQMVDKSHINTGAGAGLGAVAGQAMYLDNTSWRSYSAMNQLGAGLLGAMVGSAMDTPTYIAYEKRYWITLNDGNTIPITITESDSTHIPQGVCVTVFRSSSVLPTNESKCKKIK